MSKNLPRQSFCLHSLGMQRNAPSLNGTTEEIRVAIHLVPGAQPGRPTMALRPLRQHLARALGTRFEVRLNDPVVPCSISAWRVPESEQYAPVAPRARPVAFGLYRNGCLCGLGDLEPDFAPVHSLARGADGRFFRSCKGLERLAVAAYAWARQQRLSTPLRSAQLVRELAAISSDRPADHNPARLALVLIVLRPPHAPDWLAARLRSLGARLILARPMPGPAPASYSRLAPSGPCVTASPSHCVIPSGAT
jgi:hypothetical protein